MVHHSASTSLTSSEPSSEKKRPSRLVLKVDAQSPIELKPLAKADSPRSPQSSVFQQPEGSEPFPDLTESSATPKEDMAHCYQHCRHTVCRFMSRQREINPECVCQVDPNSLQSPKSTTVSTSQDNPAIPRPIINLSEDHLLLPIHSKNENRDDNEIINISEEDANDLAEKYVLTLPSSVHYWELTQSIQPRANLLKSLFKALMSLYIHRRVRNATFGLTRKEFRMELRSYCNTALRDWQKKFPEDIDDEVMEGDFRFYLQDVRLDISGSGTVAWFMTQSMFEMEEMLVWWSRQMKDYGDEVQATREKKVAEKAAKELQKQEEQQQHREREMERERRANRMDLNNIFVVGLFVVGFVWLFGRL